MKKAIILSAAAILFFGVNLATAQSYGDDGSSNDYSSSTNQNDNNDNNNGGTIFCPVLKTVDESLDDVRTAWPIIRPMTDDLKNEVHEEMQNQCDPKKTDDD